MWVELADEQHVAERACVRTHERQTSWSLISVNGWSRQRILYNSKTLQVTFLVLPSVHPSLPATTTPSLLLTTTAYVTRACKAVLFCDSAATGATQLHTTVPLSCKCSLGPGTPCLWSRGPHKSLCAHLLLGLRGLAATRTLGAVRPPPLCD